MITKIRKFEYDPAKFTYIVSRVDGGEIFRNQDEVWCESMEGAIEFALDMQIKSLDNAPPPKHIRFRSWTGRHKTWWTGEFCEHGKEWHMGPKTHRTRTGVDTGITTGAIQEVLNCRRCGRKTRTV